MLKCEYDESSEDGGEVVEMWCEVRGLGMGVPGGVYY
jgi:hypothetical protein